ncbi:MAG: hypothetical protein LBJ11_04355 [Oscillospiraceae bacterium]|jgi:formate C-acetyltransferase|nr:hypothetical protein [Oscillospiraceae bacterium]
MSITETPQEIIDLAKTLFLEERSVNHLEGWFLAREASRRADEAGAAAAPPEKRAALELLQILRDLPLSLSAYAVFAGTQRDAFARSYALINPEFRVETFSGYCDPTAVFGDIQPTAEISQERIDALRDYTRQGDYVQRLSEVYAAHDTSMSEVAFFVEQVTGHLIPDFRPALGLGTKALGARIRERLAGALLPEERTSLEAMALALEGAELLAERYADLAAAQIAQLTPGPAERARRARLERLEAALRKVPAEPAENLFEAIQSFLLLWQVMCLEQAPNPFAFSVGNADRIFEPYRARSGESREEAAALLRHFLVFFNVGDRSWAISQNILIGGRDADGGDLTNLTSYALLDAYHDMNLPQPILSVKIHKNTPMELYRELGRFWFTPGCLTPSLFQEDALFTVLGRNGVAPEDLPDISVAGCQEPLIMGKDNGNTTNSWLNLPKILELTLNGGRSLITGKPLLPDGKNAAAGTDPLTLLRGLRTWFYQNLETFADEMAEAANGASAALSHLPVPFLSACMGGIESGADLRDPWRQGTKYNGSGCLIHGLSVLADSFVAVDCLLRDRPQDAERLLTALRNNFEDDPELRDYLTACPKFGNHIEQADREAAEIARKVSGIVAARKNYLGNPFRPDWSTPSTHLLYGYWVGATPDGRRARGQLNYGVDPLFGEADMGLGLRVLSSLALPFECFSGGYASHLGIDPRYFPAPDFSGKGEQFYEHVIASLFFPDGESPAVPPFYLYVNVTTPETLRKVLSNPPKYAPSGVYIVRIHGTFVNFLDLSPAIQQDIIARLDLASTNMG